MDDLTKRQIQILEYVKKYISDNSYPPSVRDIMKYFEMKSPRAAHKHLMTLEEKGYIERNKVSRGIRLTAKSGEIFTSEKVVPVVGKIAAGAAIEAIENITDMVPLPYNFFNTNGDYFALKVEGESMIEAHIMNNDYVIIRKQEHANDSDIIVALIDDSMATLKRLKKKGKKTLLIPENSEMEPIEVDTERLKIQGIMVGLIRVI